MCFFYEGWMKASFRRDKPRVAVANKFSEQSGRGRVSLSKFNVSSSRSAYQLNQYIHVYDKILTGSRFENKSELIRVIFF